MYKLTHSLTHTHVIYTNENARSHIKFIASTKYVRLYIFLIETLMPRAKQRNGVTEFNKRCLAHSTHSLEISGNFSPEKSPSQIRPVDSTTFR